jgi:phosphomannomutase
MVYKIIFGTDGWRGMIGREYTFDNLRRCAQGFASYHLDKGNSGKKVVVGYDRRFLSKEFSQTVSTVLAANGFKVLLTDDATPTPVISYSVVAYDAIGAVNITASHNPPTDNGFKVRDEFGGAIAPDGLAVIESLIPDNIEDIKDILFAEAVEKGRIELFDSTIKYFPHIEELLDLEPLRNAGFTVVVDAMWGNGSGWFSKLLDGGSTKVIEYHNEINPSFPEMKRPEPIPPNVDAGLEFAKKNNADVVLILDGDSDRVGIGDENGDFINQLRVFGLLAYYLLEVRKMSGPIVKTLSTTKMLNKLGKIYDVPVYETGVGFKYVAPKFMEVDAIIGGEESGGYAFKGNVPERDGLLGGLYFLDMMVKTGLKPTQLLDKLFEKVGEHFYDRIDTIFSGDRQEKIDLIKTAKPESIGGLKVTGLNDSDGFQFYLEDGGWLLIRFSGTEPKIRVYCETTHGDKVQDILKDGLKIAGIE